MPRYTEMMGWHAGWHAGWQVGGCQTFSILGPGFALYSLGPLGRWIWDGRAHEPAVETSSNKGGGGNLENFMLARSCPCHAHRPPREANPTQHRSSRQAANAATNFRPEPETQILPQRARSLGLETPNFPFKPSRKAPPNPPALEGVLGLPRCCPSEEMRVRSTSL